MAFICVTVTACPEITVINYISAQCAINHWSRRRFTKHTPQISALFNSSPKTLVQTAPPPLCSFWISSFCFTHPSWGMVVQSIFGSKAPELDRVPKRLLFYWAVFCFWKQILSVVLPSRTHLVSTAQIHMGTKTCIFLAQCFFQLCDAEFCDTFLLEKSKTPG